MARPFTEIEHGTLSGYRKHAWRKDSKCQQCWNARAAYMREQRKLPEQKLKELSYRRAWSSRNMDKKLEYSRKYYKKNSEKLAAQQRKNRAKNPNFKANQAAASHRRRSRMYGQEYDFFKEKEILEKYGTKCHLCGGEIDINAPRASKARGKLGENWQNALHIDHIVPLSKGGTHTIDNVRPAHAWCNLSKGNKI
jgi:5-methylcytosine-specific restriction endonuclease McrA